MRSVRCDRTRWCNDRHHHRGDQRERRAKHEGTRRSMIVPDPAEDERRGQRAQSNCKVVPTEGGASSRTRHDVSYERLLGSFSHSIEDSVDSKERPRLPRRASPGKCEVHRGVQQPAADNQRLATDSVGKLPAICASRRLQDRKSTRLNSSHVEISYAVFCLKKKKKKKNKTNRHTKKKQTEYT